jgi:secreted trypsin-like serine protease
MVASVNDRITLVGVTSFGDGCAKSPFPGVYARVTAQKSWILANTDAGSCQN